MVFVITNKMKMVDESITRYYYTVIDLKVINFFNTRVRVDRSVWQSNSNEKTTILLVVEIK